MAAPLSPRPDIRVTSKTLSHHLSHAATCALTSPFEDCVVMVLDGFAEDRCSAFFHFHDNRFDPIETGPLKSLEREVVNRSFGTAYAVATSLCGFKPTEGEEWKVMGLAGYGLERPEIQDFFNAHTCVDGLIVEFSWMDRAALKDLEELVGGFREFGDPDTLSAADLARNFQTCWEDALIAVASALDEMKLSPNLAFGGGCALNSSANGKILNRTGFEQLHVPCAPADDGNALGAALYEAHCVRAIPRLAEVHSPYLGSRTPVAEIERIIAFGGIAYDRAEDYTALCAHVADILVRGGIIGWMQGSAEFGPRALGNRSILADPRSVEIKQRINKTVKFREDFRPIAPAILDERGPEYFEDYQPSPYMERTLKVRCEKQGDIPSVVHVDGTARLQSVRRAWNPLFHDLLVAFDALTDVPVLANTSLNVMGKPIVHSVQDALLVFFSSGLDHMVIDRYVLSK
ncbi:MAG: carbamoyltransferase C-terminal domain-containing protein [Pseudomonadota bacterium]